MDLGLGNPLEEEQLRTFSYPYSDPDLVKVGVCIRLEKNKNLN